MTFPLTGLMAIVALIPALVLVNGRLSSDIMALLVMASFAVAVATANASALRHAIKVTRGLRLLMALPLLWLMCQIVPLPGAQISNSIWLSASDALQSPVWGHISIDLGNTIGVLLGLTVALTLIVTTILAARERQQAEILLYALCLVITLGVVELIIVELHLIPRLGVGASRETLSGLGSLGAICNLAAIVRLLDRARHNAEEQRAGGVVRPGLLICLAAFVCCVMAIGIFAPINNVIVAWLGIATFLILQVVKRWDLAPWSALSLSITGVLVAVMVVAWRYSGKRETSVWLQFSDDSPDALQTANRLLLDAPWTGSGGGCFTAVWQIYRQLTDATTGQAPTFFADIAVGGGLPMFLLITAGTIALLIILVIRTMNRRRDSHYSAAGAAATVILYFQAFCNASLATISVALTAEILVGLSLTQSISQSGRN